MTAATGRLEVNGARLYREVEGAGPAVVMVHGFPMDARVWDGTVAALRRRFQTLRYDARGFGRSTPPDAAIPYSHADDLDALMGRSGIERAHLVGLSMGGRIALDFALGFPDRVRSLVVIAASLGGLPHSAEYQASLDALARKAREGGPRAANREWLRHPLLAPAMERPAAKARLEAMIADYGGWHWTHADPQHLPSPPAARRLAEIRVPALVMVGEKDLPEFRETADRIAAGIPGARRVTLPGVGHLPPLEDPERFHKLLVQFLDQS